jgi:electron transfer flavoprotein beta subunit
VRVAAVVEGVWDPASVEVDAWSGTVDLSRVAPIPGPGSLEAVETGLRLGEAVAYAVGPHAADAVLRRCLAMGAAAVRVLVPDRETPAPDVGARALAQALAAEDFDLILTPARSGDQSASLLGPLLAGLLDLPQATAVEQLRVDQAGREAFVRRRLDRGERAELALPLPAVIALEPGIVAPRNASPSALLSAQLAAIPTLEAPIPAALSLAFLGHQPPRPPGPWMEAPDSSQSAEARISAVVGGRAESRRLSLVSGPPDELAESIIKLLGQTGNL